MSTTIKTVLLVDDSDLIRSRLSKLISHIGHFKISGETNNTKKAIELCESIKPDFVILDLSIPEDGGFHVLEIIKDKTPDTTVIIFTNYNNDAYRRKCINLGADYFLDKSKDFDKIRQVLLNSL